MAQRTLATAQAINKANVSKLTSLAASHVFNVVTCKLVAPRLHDCDADLVDIV